MASSKIKKLLIIISSLILIIITAYYFIKQYNNQKEEEEEKIRQESYRLFNEIVANGLDKAYEDEYAKKAGLTDIKYKITKFNSYPGRNNTYAAWITFDCTCSSEEIESDPLIAELAGYAAARTVQETTELENGKVVSTEYDNDMEGYSHEKTFTINVNGETVKSPEIVPGLIGDAKKRAAIKDKTRSSMITVVFIIILSIGIIVGWLAIFPNGVRYKIAEIQIKEKTDANSALMKRAKSLCDRRNQILSDFKNNVDYEKLKIALDVLPSAYNRWAQEILAAPMVGKKPMNPFVAAGIGDSIAGLGGAVMMGVAAQNENNKYEERLALFKSQLARINVSGDKVAFLVDEIETILKWNANDYIEEPQKGMEDLFSNNPSDDGWDYYD